MLYSLSRFAGQGRLLSKDGLRRLQSFESGIWKRRIENAFVCDPHLQLFLSIVIVIVSPLLAQNKGWPGK